MSDTELGNTEHKLQENEKQYSHGGRRNKNTNEIEEMENEIISSRPNRGRGNRGRRGNQNYRQHGGQRGQNFSYQDKHQNQYQSKNKYVVKSDPNQNGHSNQVKPAQKINTDLPFNIVRPQEPSIQPPPTSILEESKDDFNITLPNIRSRKAKSTGFAIDDDRDVEEFAKRVPVPMITYPFELDTFQKRAIMRLEERENVFVAAHTSAGKTVVAEYAIALARQQRARVIYTSPIKALSNQKYREFKDSFEEVGILTGDVSVDPDSFCVIMTTEILRSMLYKGSSKLRDLEWVILDEVHYINDAERGVVWEEVLILLPPHVRIVMLSATAPNYMEFSDWVGRVRQQKVYVQVTFNRPVPLEHWIYAQGELYQFVDMEGVIKENVYDAVMSKLNTRDKKKGKSKNKKKERGYYKSEDQQYKELVLRLQNEELLPCVIFAFSRDKVDHRGEKLSSVDLIDDEERKIVMQFANHALDRLNPIDRHLPQIEFVMRLLERGIGVHHSGILPILKEIVEILFSRGLIKVLVATETFSMGLNMPTKTVVFCELKKFDGNSNRYLLSGEYTQMSGRAGRRGKDSKGYIINFFRDKRKVPPLSELKTIVKSEARTLESQFRIRYNQVCNVLNTEGMSMNELISKSFLENSMFNNSKAQAQNHIMREKIMKTLSKSLEGEDNQIFEFIEIVKRVNELSTNFQMINKAPDEGSFMEINLPNTSNLPAILIAKASKIKCLIFDVDKAVEGFTSFSGGNYSIKEIDAANIITVYKAKLPKTMIAVLKRMEYDDEYLQIAMTELLKGRTSSTLPSRKTFMHNSPDYSIRDELVQKIINHPCFAKENRNVLWQDAFTLVKYKSDLNQLKSEPESDSQDINRRIDLLKNYHYLSDLLTLELKGRVLALIDNPYNLVISECIFEGLFTKLSTEELAATVSVFVTEDRSKIEDKDWSQVSQGLDFPLKRIQAVVSEICESEEKLDIKSEMSEDGVKLSMVEVVYLWAQGKPFVEICQITSIKEGNIVRGILRVHDLLTTFIEVAEVIGDHDLKEKSRLACISIQRDIAFAASLYISD